MKKQASKTAPTTLPTITGKPYKTSYRITREVAEQVAKTMAEALMHDEAMQLQARRESIHQQTVQFLTDKKLAAKLAAIPPEYKTLQLHLGDDFNQADATLFSVAVPESMYDSISNLDYRSRSAGFTDAGKRGETVYRVFIRLPNKLIAGNKDVVMPADRRYGSRFIPVTTGAFAAAVTQLELDFVGFIERIENLRGELVENMQSAGTTKRLKELWPEAATFIDAYFVDKEHVHTPLADLVAKFQKQNLLK